MQQVNGGSPTPVRNIAILGAAGNLGNQILVSFLDHNKSNPSNSFNIIALTRDASFERTTKQLKNYLDDSSSHLQVKSIDRYGNQNAVSKVLRDSSVEVLISTIATLSTNEQTSIVDACVASGTVKRFFPSEFGVDTSSRPLLEKYLPLAELKLEVVEHLKKVAVNTHGHFSWTAIIVGAFFDWAIMLPGVLGFNIPHNQVTVFDGGDIKYEATNLQQIGRAVVACLASQEAFDQSADQYVYVNSFTVTQNQVAALVEKFTGQSMKRIDVSSAEMSQKSREILAEKGGLGYYRNFEPTPENPYAAGSIESIWPAIFGGEKAGGFNQYSTGQGLWNERLRLPKEDVEESVKGVVQALGLMKA